jgi:sarcosine oxidase
MTHPTYDAIVLGVGGMGSAAVFELARRGRRVLGLEQFSLVHDRGSSHGQTRVIRKAYAEHPDYVPLLRRAYERWYDLEQRQELHLFTECGCLSIGRPDGDLVPGVRRAAEIHQLPIEELGPADLRRRYSAFHFGDGYEAVLERDAGFLAVEECVRAFIREAQRLGADIRANEPVLSWQATGHGVVVRTAQQEYRADRLVITAGAWAAAVLRDLGLPLTVSRKVLLWFGTSDDRLFRRDVFPVYMAEMPEGFFYGFPVVDRLGHKVARHDSIAPIDNPASLDRSVSAADEAECRPFVRAYLPAADGPLRQGKVCMYTLTPDHHFVIDVHPAHPQVAIAAGFSGHGFKFASAVGLILADLAEQGQTDLPIGMFRMGRFGIPRS